MPNEVGAAHSLFIRIEQESPTGKLLQWVLRTWLDADPAVRFRESGSSFKAKGVPQTALRSKGQQVKAKIH